MVLFWEKNCICYANDKKSIEIIILSMRTKILLEHEEDLAGFLGINIERNKENNKTISAQRWLTSQILQSMHMVECNIKYTPADKDPLHKYLQGEPCFEDWDYRSIVEMMLYLAGNTRPDIVYTVHQYAQFSHNSQKVTK